MSERTKLYLFVFAAGVFMMITAVVMTTPQYKCIDGITYIWFNGHLSTAFDTNSKVIPCIPSK